MLRPNARSHSITSQESFSAVMITDLVADVNVSPELENSTKSTKEETNLGYDGHMDGEVKRSPPSEDTDTPKVNGVSVTKGVILNAQFDGNDSKTKIDEKSVQLTSSLPVPTLIQQITEPKGFKDMSLKRKIAFGFSFLPSIFFVLCFAVILPCNVPRPCIEEVWITKFNNTEATSRLELPNDIVFTALKEAQNIFVELTSNDGSSSAINIPSSVSLKCGKIIYGNRTDCIVMDDSGKIYSFSDSQSKVLWDPVPETEKLPPPPAILPDCSGNMDEVAIAVSNTIIKILYNGNMVSNFPVSHCDSIPMKLTPWKVNGSSDVVFVCDKDGEDRLVKVPKNVWCSKQFAQNSTEEALLLLTGALDSIKESIFLPLEDNGLVLWSENETFLIQSNGVRLWKATNLSHSEENRFILYGKFIGENKQLAFFSSSFISGLQVTLLDPSDGSVMKTASYQAIEATEIMHIIGKNRDFALLLLTKFVVSDAMTAAFTQISDIASTIASIITNEKLRDDIQHPTTEELAVLDLDGNLESVTEINDRKDSTRRSTMTAISDKKTGILSAYLLTTSYNEQMKTTEVRRINIANWDKSTKSKCLAK